MKSVYSEQFKRSCAVSRGAMVLTEKTSADVLFRLSRALPWVFSRTRYGTESSTGECAAVSFVAFLISSIIWLKVT